MRDWFWLTLLGIAIILGVSSAYIFLGEFGNSLSHRIEDWTGFAAYFGGVAGSLLSFLALVVIARNMSIQQQALELAEDRVTAEQHLRLLDALYDDIREVLDRPLALTSGTTGSLRQVVYREVAANQVDAKLLTDRFDQLMRLTGQYCQAVSLYRENVTEFFDARIFADRGGRVLDLIKPFHHLLGSQGAPSIDMCDMLLQGEESRAAPEALTRSSRMF